MTNNSLPGSKRDEEANLENCNSEDTTKACEPCEKSLKCLVHVEFENTQDAKKYLWKGGCGPLSKESNLKIIGFQGEGEAYEAFKLKCLVEDSKCIGDEGPFPERCSNVYYYEYDTSEKPQVIGDILEGLGQNPDDLELKFNDAYLDEEKKLIPHYLVAQEVNEEGEELAFEVDIKGRPLYQKEFTLEIKNNYRTTSTDVVSHSIMANQIINTMIGNELTKFLRRSISFGLLSKLDYMPASAYHIAVMDCKNSDMNQLKKNDLGIYSFFDEAAASVYVAPHYEVTHSGSIKFDSISGGFTLAKLLSALKKIDFSCDIQEKFNGVEGAKANLVIKDPLEILKQVFTKNYVLITILIEVLSGAPRFLEKHFPSPEEIDKDISFGVNNKSLFDEIVSISMGLPNISFSGSSILEIKDGKPIIKRKDVKLAAKPLVDGTLKFNLASLFIQSTGILKTAYAALSGAARLANRVTDRVRLDISTDKDFREKFSTAEKAERANALVEGSLVIYAEFLIKPSLNPAFDISTSELNETKFESNMTKAVAIGVEFSAGMALRGRVYRVYGGLDAGFEISTGLSYGNKSYPRTTTEGKKYQECVDFIYFNGLTATWKLDYYGGVDYGLAETEHGDLGVLDKTKDQLQNKHKEPIYFDPEKAREERDAAQGVNQDYLDYLEKETQSISWGAGDDDYLEIYDKAASKYPDRFVYTQKDKQLNFYNQNKSILDEIKRLNIEIACTFDPSTRLDLLQKKYRLMVKINQDMLDHGINLVPGDYNLLTLTDEFDARNEYIEYLKAKKEEWLDKSNAYYSDPNVLKPNSKSLGLGKQARELSEYYEEEIAAVKRLDGEQASLFDAHLFGVETLSSSEREALEKELKE